MIRGHADLKGTSAYFQKESDIQVRLSPFFSVSPIALGTHLGDMTDSDSALYQEAIRYGLMHGINMVDTALNYRGMKSERDVGAVLRLLLLEQEGLQRDQLVISTKAGIIPGDIDANLVPADYLEQVLYKQKIISPADVNVVDHHRHVLSPEYFRFAIAQSRHHLQLETVDIYYIHNPEISMMVLGPDSFYKKLIPLFSFFEEQVEKGRISFYGMATWEALLLPEGKPGYISLEKVGKIANSVAGEHHHFRFLQTPYHQCNPDAGRVKNQQVAGKSYTLLDAAERLGVFVTSSAPFNLGKIFKEEISAEEALMKVVKTRGIFSTMAGMKQTAHVRKNIETVKGL